MTNSRASRTMLAGTLGCLMLLVGCGRGVWVAGAGNTGDSSHLPKSLVVEGNLRLLGARNIEMEKDGSCVGANGYEDFDEYNQVEIKGPSDEKVAFGEVKPGRVTKKSSGKASECTFDFTVSDVPRGLSVYTVETTQRGGPDYHEDELEDGVSILFGDD